MKRCLISAVMVALGASMLSCAGCSGNTITLGTTPVTSIAPSNTFNYPVGPSGDRGPPSPKELVKEGKIPGKGRPPGK